MLEPQNNAVFRPFLALALVLGLTISLPACGDQGDDSDDGPSVMDGVETPAADETTVESPEGAPAIAMGDMTMGPVDAPVTIIEYASLTCHHCANFYSATFVRLKPDYIDTGKVHFIFRDFPLDRIAYEGAVMARCAGDDHYFDVVDKLFTEQEKWMPRSNSESEIARTRGMIQKYGEEYGVTEEAFQACLANKELEKRLLARIEEARNRYEVNATPTIIINGEKYEGPRAFTTIAKHIEDLMAAE